MLQVTTQPSTTRSNPPQRHVFAQKTSFKFPLEGDTKETEVVFCAFSTKRKTNLPTSRLAFLNTIVKSLKPLSLIL